MIAYVKAASMLTLCLVIPPLGWLFMYKYSTFDRKTNLAIVVACTAFFVSVIATSSDLKTILAPFSGEVRGFEYSLTPEQFREKFNASAQKLAPNLNLKLDEPFTVDEKIFRHEFNPKLALEGTTDDSGQITALKIFAEPENKDESFQTLNVLGLLIATLNPELDQDDRSEVIRDLRMLKEVSTEGVYDWTTSRGNVEYSVHADTGKVTFTAALGHP